MRFAGTGLKSRSRFYAPLTGKQNLTKHLTHATDHANQ